MTAALQGDLLNMLSGTLPKASAWYPVHQLLTAAPGGPPAVCLLSQAELRATPVTVSAAVRSSRAAANLAASPAATLVCWAGRLHYVSLELRATTGPCAGVHGYLFDVRDVRVDDIGIELRPLEYRMEAWLAKAERWDATTAILNELAAQA